MINIRHKKKRNKTERIIGVIALMGIIAAWFVGIVVSKADIMPSLKQVAPKAQRFQALGRNTFASFRDESGRNLIGYVRIASSMGYGGPVTVAVATDINGAVTGIVIVDHKETPTYFNRIMESSLIEFLIGKTYEDNLVLGQDVDGISGASRSTAALLDSVRSSIRDISANQLGLNVLEEKNHSVSFGVPEIALLLLFALSVMARKKSFKFRNAVRWISLLIGLIVLGFIYDNPLTISMINQILLCFWPDWHTNLYRYLLISGILLFLLFENKNPYCVWFCPFGAAQEFLAKIGKAKSKSPGRYRYFLKWLHRWFVWASIIIALLFRDPGLTSYEIFGALFRMWGSTIQFILLAMVLLTSIFVLRPWCNYLCPIRPVEAYLRMMKKWAKEIWPKKSPVITAE